MAGEIKIMFPKRPLRIRTVSGRRFFVVTGLARGDNFSDLSGSLMLNNTPISGVTVKRFGHIILSDYEEDGDVWRYRWMVLFSGLPNDSGTYKLKLHPRDSGNRLAGLETERDIVLTNEDPESAPTIEYPIPSQAISAEEMNYFIVYGGTDNTVTDVIIENPNGNDIEPDHFGSDLVEGTWGAQFSGLGALSGLTTNLVVTNSDGSALRQIRIPLTLEFNRKRSGRSIARY